MGLLSGVGGARRATLVAATAVALAGLTAPVLAGPAAASKPPSHADIAKAKHRVAVARHHLGSLRDRAEAAVEAYHAAVLVADRAHRTADAKAAAADAARQAALVAARAADAARAAASALEARAEVARQQLAAAKARVEAATQVLDSIAVAAYTSGGRVSQLGSMIDSQDPTEFSQRQAMVAQVDRYQQSVLDELAIAKADQETATRTADDAAATARQAATNATDKADAASSAAATARAAAREARDAYAAADAAATDAARAKARAAAAVRAQSATVSDLVATVKKLQEAAAEAKRQAELARRHHVTAPSSAAATAIEWAFKEIGVPYSWGGGNADGPTYGVAQGAHIKGFDCSGLTLFAYAHAGITLDHYTGSQWNSGQHVARGQEKPGDLFFFATNTADPATIHHVGLYIGHGQMIEAPETGLVVRVSTAFRPDYIGAVRPWVSG